MARGPRKSIYYIGSVILAALLFLALFFFDEDKDFQTVMIDSSLSGNSGALSDMGGGQSEEQSSSTNPDQSSESSDASGDGEGGSGSGTDGDGRNLLFSAYSEIQDFMYFRQDGMGTYTGKGYHGFTGNDRYYLGDGDLNPLYFFAQTLSQSGFAKYDVTIEGGSVKSELLPYFPIDMQESNDGKSYTVSYYKYDYLAMDLNGLNPIGGNAYYHGQELLYRQFVENTFLEIDQQLRGELLTIAANNGIYAGEGTWQTAHKVVNYVQNAAYYDYYYADKSYPSDVDMVTHFLTEARRGVCRHFAAAATMMFRALGIPSRYCIGFAVGVNDGVWTDVYGDGHAWTEIYLDGYGWVPLEVTGSTLAPDGENDETGGDFEGDIFYGNMSLCHACVDTCGKKRYTNP